MQCSDRSCPAVRCHHPYTPSRGCCPECSRCLFNGRTYNDGQRFMSNPCTTCECRRGSVVCSREECPRLRCQNQETPPGSCCPVCSAGCQFEGNRYMNGELFRPVGSPCRNCSCQNGVVVCRGQECRPLSCPRPIQLPGSCCPECTDCTHGDRVYRNRQSWTLEDGCQRCACERGNIVCNDIYACERKCSHGLKVSSQCCSECSRCSFDARTYRDGETFINRKNPCQQCTCTRGNVTCERISCPTLHCTDQRTESGHCCPTCASCMQGRIQREHGSSWRLQNDACTTCSCRAGEIRCVTEPCNRVPCQYPVSLPNSCCPSCSGCLYGGIRYSDGDEIETDETCRSCKCKRGNVVCHQQSCEVLSCQSQVTIPGQCCPRCASCTYEQETYKEGETFTSPRNPCLHCTCESGETKCVRKDLDCPELDCANPGRTYGECCSTCGNCEYQRRNYRNDETFTPPGASPCLICTCTNGTVSCQTDMCEGIRCHNPVNVPGQCCPICQECLFDGVTYSSGDTWSPDSCTTCSCISGRANCRSIPCPKVTCSHPARLPNTCCASCGMCSMENRIYSNQRSFPHPTQPCKLCKCESGSITCKDVACPSLTCHSPVTVQGSCCPSCPGTCVTDDGSKIENGIRTPHPTDECQTCLCSDGLFNCTQLCEANPPCRHPTDGECCKDNCDGCYFRGNNYYNGEEFPHARDTCRTCRCNRGNVRCRRHRCPRATCDKPVKEKGSCCATCKKPSSCEFKGRSVSNGHQFVDNCQVCQCDDGAIKCRPKSCPRVSCSYPVVKDCCRYCGGCRVDGTDYENGDVVPNHSQDSCSTCRCAAGDVVCALTPCSKTSCTHPASGGCCPICQDCLYDGSTFKDGSSFDSSEDACDVCTCTKGSVTCQRKTCEASNCTHPVTSPESCCPVCGSECFFEGEVYMDGFTLPQSGADSCQICSCLGGSVTCTSRTCPDANCRNPSTGECGCAMCDGCNYNGVSRRNRETFTNPDDEECSECYCQDGNVNCGRRHCQSSTCTHPTLDACDCPLCNNCLYHDETYQVDEVFMDLEDTCNTCTCKDGNVVCRSRTCAQVECANPSIDKCGCPICMKCNYLGVEYDNNAYLVDSMNKCNQCVCRVGTVQCALRPCPPARCANPATPFGECCPKCIGECAVEGQTFENGASFTLPSDPCSSCTCTNGDVRCLKQRCERTCSHPITRTQCCPDCSACLFQNRLIEDGEIFTPRSDPCQRCSCYRGNMICQDMQCPVPDCANPRTVRGHCCPQCELEFQQGCSTGSQIYEVGSKWLRRSQSSCSECTCGSGGVESCTAPVCDEDCDHPLPQIGRCCRTCDSCFYLNHTYSSGELFHPNSCQDCLCTRGNVQCVTKACRPLTCAISQQVQMEGECCPRCISCSTQDHAYAEGEIWSPPSHPCVTCQCQQGVVTCQRAMCLPACKIFNNIPGRCCLACSSCRYRSKSYEIGEHFEPNPMNPCEICECFADENGAPALSCHRIGCPSLADCPRSCISQPAPGECCPTCSNRLECSYGNCNAATRGEQIYPTDNPCFSCICNVNNTWECSPVSCRKLDCPQSAQYTPKGSCCPICDACHIGIENRDVVNGFTWKVNECRSCRCDHGSIICDTHDCDTPTCVLPMIPYKPEGQCCEQCVNPHTPCTYEGHSVSSQHRWLVDKCTACRCFAGQITCVTRRCSMLMCNSDEVASVIPGDCCPRCIKQPASCVAFGDPHYRTFDGRMVNFQGTCRYLFTQDCVKRDFRVEVENSRLGDAYGAVSWTDKVFLTVSGHKVAMTSDYAVSVNGTAVQLPILIQPYLFVTRSGSSILINTHIGVHLSWNAAQRHLEVNVPGSYKRRTCGLCGDFNNYPRDDLRLKKSRMTNSDVTFGNHWKVSGRGAPVCADAVEYNPCDSLSYAQRKKANTACKIIRSPLFAPCHQVVNPEMYFSACVQDVCACGENRKFCLCDALEAYAAACRRSGAVISWRSSTLCSIHCPTDRGYVFDECGSPCKRTCANKNLPPEEIDRQCFMPCVSGCQCVAGQVEHEGRCINPNLCPENISTIELTNAGRARTRS